jgi:hypothetical protein
MKYKLTKQQFKNLTEAVNFWLKVPRNTVTSKLQSWRGCEYLTPQGLSTPSCGSTACFGGWLPYSPYFSSLGVQAVSRLEGHPILRTNGITEYDGKALAGYLFGERELFAGKYYWSEDYPLIEELGANYSDWGLVLMRLAYVIDNADLINDPV